MEKMFYNVQEAAELLLTSPLTVRAKIKEGTIPANRVGRKFLIPSEYFKRIRAAALVQKPCKETA